MWLKNIKENRDSYMYWGYIAIIGIIFYLMNCFTPLFSDDWHYCFIYGTTYRINSIADIIKSQYIHYYEMNGRLIPHIFVQFFDSIAGKECFNIINTIVFIIFIRLLCKTINYNKHYNDYTTLTLVTFCIIFLMPGFNYNYLWMSGSCNYLWSAVILLQFNLLLKNNIKNKYLYPFLFIYAIIAGWTHEGIVIGLAGGYFIYFMLYPKELIPHSRKILLTGLFIGIAFLVFSPASINRAISSGPKDGLSFISIIRHIIVSLTAMDNIILLPILILILIIKKINKSIYISIYFKENIVFIITIILNFIFILLTKHDTVYSRFGFELISLILIISLIHNHFLGNKYLYAINTIIILFLLFILPISYNNYKEYRNVVKQIKQIERKGIVQTKNIQEIIPYHLRRYLIHYYSFAYYKYYPPYDALITKYFSKESLIFLPQEFINDIQSHPEHYNKFYTTESLPFYAKRLEPECKSVNNVIYNLRTPHEDEIPFYHKPFAHNMSRYSCNTFEANPDYYSIVNINNISYLIVGKNKLIDNRIEHIIYE